MLKPTMMQEILDMKLQGLTVPEIQDHYRNLGVKPPSLPTIRKYYAMDAVPDQPGKKLEKEKAFDAEPFRSAIIEVLRSNEGNPSLCISSVYDVLEEKFVESGQFPSLPGNQQTLRNFVRYLRENEIINATPKNSRIYDHVFDTPPGEQMLIDFGQVKDTAGRDIYFICLLLRYSRFLSVYAQDHKYNSVEACRAIYRSFCRLGGRPSVLVIDQDAVFVASETYGEVVKTHVFEDFCTEQELKLWVCYKADPESKGPIENSVGFVKKNFFSARRIDDIEDVWRSLPGWLVRKNHRIHQATFSVPEEIFRKFEQKDLRPLIPSFYEESPVALVTADLKGDHYIRYRSCRYSVPRELAFGLVYYKVVKSRMYIYGPDKKFVCAHAISECKGRCVELPEHRKQAPTDWIPIAERMRTKWNCVDFQHFINGVKKENPRYIAQQLDAIDRFLDSQKADRGTVAVAMKISCEKFRYKFSQFRVVYQMVLAGRVSDNAYTASAVQTQDMSVYAKAFRARCAQ